MKKPTFLFIAFLLFTFPFLSGGVELSMESQFVISMGLVFTIGIAHGSVDNVLYLKKSSMRPLRFYLIYLSFAGTFALLWFVFPLVAITLFLLISAYHFGQSQLTDYFRPAKFSHKVLFFVWGIALLSALVSLKSAEVSSVLASYEDLRVFSVALNPSVVFYIHVVSTLLVTFYLLYFVLIKQLSFARMCFELFMLVVINFSFAVLPPLLGFTVYFTFLHSLKVLEDEFRFLKTSGRVGIIDFIKQLLPNTLISAAATAIIFVAIHFNFLDLSYGFVLLVLISSITFPHVFVMEKFYDATN